MSPNVVHIGDFNGNCENPFPFQFLVMRVVNTLEVPNRSSLAVGHMPTGLFWMKEQKKQLKEEVLSEIQMPLHKVTSHLNYPDRHRLFVKARNRTWQMLGMHWSDSETTWWPEFDVANMRDGLLRYHCWESGILLPWWESLHLNHTVCGFLGSKGRGWERKTVSWKAADR